MASVNFVKVQKISFSSGTVSLYVNTNGAAKNREIAGKVVVKLGHPSFIKGAWIKLIGSNTVSSERSGLISYDLFTGDDEHHRDGLHQVLCGFGEGDNSHGAYLELTAGRHSWPFHFRLPHHAPASYFDGTVSISYKLVAMVESPIIQTASSRLVLSHDWLVQNYSNYSYVRIKEMQMIENKDLLQKGNDLFAPVGKAHPSGGILPSIMNLMRTPTKLSIRGNPSQTVSAVPGNSGEHCALFPFQNKEHLYEVLCSINNLRTKHPVTLKCELYVEICTRTSASHSYPTVYPTKIGQQNPTLDEPNMHALGNRSHTSAATHLIWEGTTDVASQLPDQQMVLKVPIVVNTTARTAALNHKPQPYALQPTQQIGKIVHYTVEAPLFRYRTMLKVSMIRSDASGQVLCAPVFGEIFILPPRPGNESQNAVSNTLVPIRTTLPTDQQGISEPIASSQAQETLQPSPVGNVVTDSAPSRVRRFSRSEALETPRGSEPAASAPTVTFYEDSVISQNTSSGVTNAEGSTAPAPTAAHVFAPTRPMSGNGRPSRSARNAGGIASFRAQNSVNRVSSQAAEGPSIVAVPVGAGAGGENVNPNIVAAGNSGNKTPHAKPTRSSHVIRVDAELISRGPAAVVIDRNERRNEPIRTPQRFVVMYQLGTAVVIDGTPVVMAPTPNIINTVEFRANRRNFAHYPPNTAERGALFEPVAGEPETPRCVTEGFQYNCAVDSHAGTPEPPRRYSISESFDGQVLFDEGQALPASAVAMPLPAEDELPAEASHLFREALHGATPRQRQLFRGTFDGVDWLALNHSTSAAVLDTLPNTMRSDVPSMTLESARTADVAETMPALTMPETPVRATPATLAC